MKSRNNGKIRWRLWMRNIHREVSYFFAGMLLIYAISGIVMNHRDSINPQYSIEVIQMPIPEGLNREQMDREQVIGLLEPLDEAENYTRHYFPEKTLMKVFLKGGSNLTADFETGEMTYEKVSKRVLIGAFAKLHYNPGRWWTWFADAFGVALIVITLSGLVMLKGRTGLWGRGGILTAAGILIPLLFLLI